MKENRATLITILVLLGIFGSITLFGTLVKLKSKIESSNPNHEFIFNNQLYFYNENDELLGTYECKTNNCGYIKTIIDDDEYGIDYYKDGTEKELKYMNEDYVYFQDGEKIMQYSFASEKVIMEFDAWKNYYTNLKNDLVFFKRDNKWGVFSLKEGMIVNYGYTFIGLKNNIEDGVLNTDNYIVLKDSNWYILNNSFELDNSPINKTIKTYNDTYIICLDNSIYDYSGNVVIASDRFKNVFTVSNYIVGITNANMAIVYLNPLNEALGFINLEEYSNLNIKFNNNKVEFYDSGVLKQTIALN